MIFFIKQLALRISFLAGIIVFTIINLYSQETVIHAGDSTGTVSLPEELPEYLSDGYHDILLKEAAGSVSNTGHAEITAIPAGNISNLLQGRVPGVTVTGSGQPGETSKVRIRGFSSFLNNDPLYVVDGVPLQDISLLNPCDIEYISVLKDAGSASIYGSRASNGVIIVTTRKGEKGLRVNYDMSIGRQYPGKGTADEVLNTQEYANLQWLVYKNDGVLWDTHPIYGESSNKTPAIPAWAANTDWYDAMTRTAGIMNHNLSLSGGTKNARFFGGFSSFSQDGIIIYTHNKKYNARLNSDFELFKGRIKIGEAISVSSRNKNNVPNLSEVSPVTLGPYQSQSIIPVKWTGPDFEGSYHTYTEGEWGGTGISWRLGDGPNVVADLTRNKKDYFNDLLINGRAYLDIVIMKGLNFRSSFGGSRGEGEMEDYTYPTYERSYFNISEYSLENVSYQYKEWILTNSLTFDKQYGRHNIKAVAGYEALNYGMGSTESNTDTTVLTPTRMLSSFVSGNYSFDNRYYISAVFRRDGSSRFGDSNRYGTFPSFSAGWHLSNEPFLKGLSWLSDLKIRGSWGITGNQAAVSPLNAFYFFARDIASSGYDLFGTFNSAVTGYYTSKIGNPGIRWEKSEVTDIGLNAGFFKGTLDLTFDWYSKNSSDLLYNPPQPGTAGRGEPPYINVGSMRTRGIDMELTYQRKWNDFSIGASFILTSFKNRISGISDGITYFYSGVSRIGYLARNEEGHPVSSFYGYRVAGIFNTDYEVEKAPTQDGARPGSFRFENTDSIKDYIDYRDKTYIGDPNPDFTYGINLSVSWKNFDISGFLYGSQGNDIFNYNKWYTDFWPSFSGQKSKNLFYNSWTAARKDTKVPMATNSSSFSTNTQVCSYYIEDGSYLRLKSLQAGFSLPEGLLNDLKVKSLRIYVQAVNLFTITGYSGLDPEIGGSDMASGIDYGNYPTARQLLFGINLTL